MTLAEFLLARIAEDEAEIAGWQAAMGADEVAAVGVPSWVVMAGGLKIPRHVLAECEAKRRIVAAHYVEGNSGMHECPDEHGNEPFWAPLYEENPTPWCSTLRLLALPYAAHESYREEWKP